MTECPRCGSDDYSLLKKVQGGTLAVCCDCNRLFTIADEPEGKEVE